MVAAAVSALSMSKPCGAAVRRRRTSGREEVGGSTGSKLPGQAGVLRRVSSERIVIHGITPGAVDPVTIDTGPGRPTCSPELLGRVQRPTTSNDRAPRSMTAGL
jgi:hypothetical protein